jgi:hypothetical protein
MAWLTNLWPHNRQAWVLTSALAVAVLSLIGGGIWLGWEGRRGWTAAELEQRIQAELTPQCDRHEVEQWLKRHGIPHSYSTDTTEDRYMGFTMPMLAGLDNRSLSGQVRGVIHQPDASTDRFIDVYFFFDQRGDCVGYLVFPFEYTP